MNADLTGLLAEYADKKSETVGNLIDLVDLARRLNSDLSDQEFVTVMADVFFPILHQALNREASLCRGSAPSSPASGLTARS